MSTTLPITLNPKEAASEPRKPPHKQKLTARLDRQRTVTLTGVGSTMKECRAAILELLKRANAADKQGIELPTFLAILRDQAAR